MNRRQFLNIELDPSILDPNERLLISLKDIEIRWSKDITDFKATYKGMPVTVRGSHITRRSGGGIMGAMIGIESKVVEDYWSYSVRIETGKSRYDSISIETGEYGSNIDSLLEDLYWHVYNLHHTRSVNDILNKLEGK